MQSFEVDFVREGSAIVRILRESPPTGASFPAHLVRREDGGWWVYDH